MDKIKSFLKGWESHSTHQRPKTFWKYFIYYPLNWMWTLGSILFFILMLKGAVKYESPMIYYLSSIPIIMMAYNFTDEYYAFQWYRTGDRKITAKTLINICAGAVAFIIFSAIALMFILP